MAVKFAPGTTAPVESVTVPVNFVDVRWHHPEAGNNRAASNIKEVLRMFISLNLQVAQAPHPRILGWSDVGFPSCPSGLKLKNALRVCNLLLYSTLIQLILFEIKIIIFLFRIKSMDSVIMSFRARRDTVANQQRVYSRFRLMGTSERVAVEAIPPNLRLGPSYKCSGATPLTR